MKSFVLLWFALVPLCAQSAHELCAPCHTGPADDFKSHPHAAKGLSCDACHGKSNAHIQASGYMPPDRVTGPLEQGTLCGTCHTAQRKAYESSKHWKLVQARTQVRSPACTTCHGSHQLRTPVSLTAQCQRCHEALPAACEKKPARTEAKVGCANCHDKHAMTPG